MAGFEVSTQAPGRGSDQITSWSHHAHRTQTARDARVRVLHDPSVNSLGPENPRHRRRRQLAAIGTFSACHRPTCARSRLAHTQASTRTASSSPYCSRQAIARGTTASLALPLAGASGPAKSPWVPFCRPEAQAAACSLALLGTLVPWGPY